MIRKMLYLHGKKGGEIFSYEAKGAVFNAFIKSNLEDPLSLLNQGLKTNESGLPARRKNNEDGENSIFGGSHRGLVVPW